MRFHRSSTRFGALVATGALLLAGGTTASVADTAPPADLGVPATVSADPLPTAQVDGVVYTQVVVGDTVYAGGRFTTARPAGAAPGVSTVPRNNLLAYNIRTGVLVDSFAPSLNSQVLAVAASPDGSRLYVAGEFTSANGVNRYRIAAYSTATGALIGSFAPTLDFRARALAVTDTTVYVGGAFNSVNNNARARLAAFSTSTGALLSGWAPSADAQVWAMVLSPDGSKVIVGGQFTTLNGQSAVGMGALDATTGAVLPWAATARLIRNVGPDAAINSLTTDGTKIYGTGFVFCAGGACGTIEGGFALDPADGSVVWVQDCHGDHYSGYATGQVFYTVGHAHNCERIDGGMLETSPRSYSYGLAFTSDARGTLKRNTFGGYFNFEGTPAPQLLQWFPRLEPGSFTGQTQAGWNITGNDEFVVVGGEFPRAGGVPQQGLVRYAVRSSAPNTLGPEVKGSLMNPTATSFAAGTVRLSWQANWDRDNEELTYRLVRDSNTAAPVYVTTLRSRLWQRPAMGFTDRGLVPGQTYRYRLFVNDPLGNTSASETISVTVASDGSMSPYAQRVLDDGAGMFWRLGESSGTTAVDWAGFSDGAVGSGVSRGVAGAIEGDGNTASGFDGTANGLVATKVPQPGPQSFATEAWFRTTSTSGGKIIGFGNAGTGTSGSYDRHVYLDAGGRITFGVYSGTVRALRSASAYNDGQWHHVVASLGAEGMALYVDGQLLARDASTTSTQSYSGFWRVGGDNISGWPNQPGSAYLTGIIDEVAIYPQPLTAATVAQHYSLARPGATTNQPPTAAFTASTSGLTVSVDGRSSTDADGTISAYAWEFGDGSTASTATASRTYATAGTYPVKLTVTDDKGAKASTTRQVTVTAPPAQNIAPVARFTSSGDGVAKTFDGSTSSDADGTIASYAWDFGDGTTGTGVSPTKTYGSAGTYSVMLTVSDDRGATGSTTASVTATAPAPGNAPPSAVFTMQPGSTVIVGTPVQVDASRSTDPESSTLSYAWDFGDGRRATGVRATNTYTASGSYTITLTVTDAGGAKAVSTQRVRVARK